MPVRPEPTPAVERGPSGRERTRRLSAAVAAVAAALLLLAGVGAAMAADETGRIGPDLRTTGNGRVLEPAGRLSTLGNFPTGGALTPDGRFYWAVDAGHGCNDVKVVDVASGGVVQTLRLPGASVGIVFAPDGRSAYVSGEDKAKPETCPEGGATKGDAGDVIHVFSVDPGSGRGTEEEPITIPFPRTADSSARRNSLGSQAAINWPQGLAISPDGRTLVVALNQADKVALIDVRTRSVRPVEAGAYPYGAAVDPSGTKAYVTNEFDGTITVVDLRTGPPAAAKPLITGLGGPRGDRNAHPEGVVFDPRRKLAYVAVTNRDLIAVVDTTTDTVIRHVSVGRAAGIGTAPVSLAVSPDGRTLFSADSGEDAVAAIALTDRPDVAAASQPGETGAAGRPGEAGTPGSPGEAPATAYAPRSSRSIARYRAARTRMVGSTVARLGRTSSARRRILLRRALRGRIRVLRVRLLYGLAHPACSGSTRAQDLAYRRSVLGALDRRAAGLRRAGADRARRRAVGRAYRLAVLLARASLPRERPCAPASQARPDAPGTAGSPGTDGSNRAASVGTRAFSLIGRIPTAAYTTDVAVSPDGGRLIWLAGKGLGAGPNPGFRSSADTSAGTGPGDPSEPAPPDPEYVLDKLLGRAGVVEGLTDERIRALTPTADRQVRPANATSAPPGSPVVGPDGAPSEKIKHVFYIVRENRTYDQVFGSTGDRGDGDPKRELFDDNGARDDNGAPRPGAGVTPNAHALARRFGLLDHVYANSEVSIDGHTITGGAYATDYMQKAIGPNYAGRSRVFDFGVFPVTFPPNYFLFDQAARQGVTFRSYGEQDNGNVPGAGAVPPGPPAAPGFTNPSAASIQAQQGEDRPTYPQVQANTDPASPGNAQIGCVGPRAGDPAVNAATCTHDAGTQGEDRPGETTNGVTGGQRRFDIFKSQFLAQERAGTVPAFNYMLLMNDHTNGTTPGTYTPKALVADNDLALGQMVDVISHSSVWKDSAIFVVEDDSQDGADHVDAHRMPSFVISPYTRPGGTVIPTRYDHYSVIRTMELILGLRPLSLNDGLATPIYDAFTSGVPDLTPYSAVHPEQNLNETNKPNAPMNRLSAALPFSEVDLVPQSLSDRILWRSVYGADAQTPTPGPDASLAEQERAAGALDVYRRDGDVTGWLESHSTDGEAKGKTDAGPDPAG